MQIVTLTKDIVSDSTFEYEYYNTNATCTATDPSYTYTFADISAFKAATANAYVRDDFVQITSLKRLFRCSAATADYTSVPPSTPSVWTDYGAINSFAAFDNTLTTETTSTADFTVTFDFNKVNTLAILNTTDIVSIHVVQTDNTTATDVFDEVIAMRDYGVLSLYDYWYSPILDRQKVTDTSLHWLPNSTITIDFTVAVGGTGAVGALVSGLNREMGLTLYGSSVGYEDYSTYTTDDYGVTVFNQRPAVDIFDAEAMINIPEVDYVLNLFKEIRGTNSLFIGDERDDGFESMTVLGYVKKVKLPIENPKLVKFPIQIIGAA